MSNENKFPLKKVSDKKDNDQKKIHTTDLFISTREHFH